VIASNARESARQTACRCDFVADDHRRLALILRLSFLALLLFVGYDDSDLVLPMIEPLVSVGLETIDLVK
jgi:hypothetical protein